MNFVRLKRRSYLGVIRYFWQWSKGLSLKIRLGLVWDNLRLKWKLRKND